MEALKVSIVRDGFCAPILVRPGSDGVFDIISGNHRFLAAVETGLTEVPCLVAALDDRAARRLAVNLNTIHGKPPAELLAPFLAEFTIEDLGDIHIDSNDKRELRAFDIQLAAAFEKLTTPTSLKYDGNQHKHPRCVCPACHAVHYRKQAPG